ncbi:unnamed protein product [Phytophthora fragariaefolia]|uniref:Unnamed protein product n=1 Tax=Phytophthora fragariaefolia TaxID=1490495 RepID=A0A9W6YNL3_9STRA|nr:unnamed protein product [Phytophthora fragariaefolia]
MTKKNAIVCKLVLRGDAQLHHRLLRGQDRYVYRIDVSCRPDRKTTPAAVRVLLEEFSDVLPEYLPNELPPERAVEHEVTMRPDAVPAARTPFRHSPVERAALSACDQEPLEKGWIEPSDSPWTSSIFAVSKKDPTTGVAPKKIDWIRGGDIDHPVRWVIDYRNVNFQSIVPRIPLSRIDDILDALQGDRVFSTVDLTSGIIKCG